MQGAFRQVAVEADACAKELTQILKQRMVTQKDEAAECIQMVRKLGEPIESLQVPPLPCQSTFCCSPFLFSQASIRHSEAALSALPANICCSPFLLSQAGTRPNKAALSALPVNNCCSPSHFTQAKTCLDEAALSSLARSMANRLCCCAPCLSD